MKHNKKAFTVVELVIVIAIVAILAAVLIPTFVTLVNKANTSNTLKLVRNLNTALKADKPDGVHDTMSDALKAAEGFGYSIEKINASGTDNEILWDSVNGCFVYLENGNLKYAPEIKDKTAVADSQLWRIVTKTEEATSEALKASKYSSYLACTVTGTLETDKGIDVGNNTGITAISYVNDNEQTAVIRTASAATALTVNAPAATVKHYDVVGTVNIVAVDRNASYHEYGTANTLVVNDGHIVIENKATIVNVIVEKTAGATVSVDNKGEVSTVAGADDSVSVTGIEENKKIAAKSELVKTGKNINIDGYVKLDKDYTIDTYLVVTKNTVLDLAGKNIVFTGAEHYLWVDDVELTVIDTVGGGKITGTNCRAVYITHGAKMTLNSGAIECLTSDTAIRVDTAGMNKPKAVFVMNGGTINKGRDTKVYGITPFYNSEIIINGGEIYGVGGGAAISGNANNGGTTITINGGFIRTQNDVAIYHPQAGKLTINGGTIEGTTAVYVKSGVLTVTGGTVKGYGPTADYLTKSSGACATGDAIVLDVCGYPGGDPSAFVISSKANIVSDNGQPIVAYVGENDDATNMITLLDGAKVSYKLFRKGADNKITEIK